MMLPNMIAGQVAINLGVRGPNSCVTTACAAANHAIGDAFKIIQRGDADVMIAGGAEAVITPLAVAAFGNMKALSARNDDPKRASRPFDRERDGFVMGEGSGILVLEEREQAQQRELHLRRGRRDDRRCLPYDHARPRSAGRGPLYQDGTGRCRCAAGRGRVHQCPRHVHAVQR